MSRPKGLVLWQGRSALTGHDCAVILTGLSRASKNAKTGDMLQTWILRADMPPHEAVRSGQDVAVCGNCPLASGHGCYVRVEQAPLAVWKTWKRGGYARVSGRAELVRLMAQLGRNRAVRVGAYGDPAVCPTWVWAAVTTWARKRTGYTHQWREAELQGFCMASTHTLEDNAEAHERGYRTFRTGADGPTAGEIVCPATDEGGSKTSCAKCGLCDGSKGPQDRRKNIFAYLHGAKQNRALLAIG